MAAVDYFLNIDGIEGESNDAQFPKWIEVESWSWGVSQTIVRDGGGGGAGAGKAVPQDLSIVKVVDKASPKLFLACAAGQHIKEVFLTGRRGDTKQAYLEYKLTDVLVSSFQEAGNQGELPQEQVSFNFSKIEISYRQVLPNGQLGPLIKGGFDFQQSKTS
jgi:type VI secretion system secreted protein Hcp